MLHDLLADIAMTIVLDSMSVTSMDEQEGLLFFVDLVFSFVDELEV